MFPQQINNFLIPKAFIPLFNYDGTALTNTIQTIMNMAPLYSGAQKAIAINGSFLRDTENNFSPTLLARINMRNNRV